MLKFCSIFLGFLVLTSGTLVAQEPEATDTRDWSIDLAYQKYSVPADSDLSIGVASLYWHDLLVEGRYNYEARDSGSIWLGHSFTFGESWQFEIIPMVGSVFGDLQGAAPGAKIDVNWERLNIYSEFEYVFDFDGREGNFFYSWSEMTYGLRDWLRIGIVGNRTRAYDSPVEVDRGPIVKLEFDRITLSCTALNLDEAALIVASIEVAI